MVLEVQLTTDDALVLAVELQIENTALTHSRAVA
jgi:hypothetical protein